MNEKHRTLLESPSSFDPMFAHSTSAQGVGFVRSSLQGTDRISFPSGYLKEGPMIEADSKSWQSKSHPGWVQVEGNETDGKGFQSEPSSLQGHRLNTTEEQAQSFIWASPAPAECPVHSLTCSTNTWWASTMHQASFGKLELQPKTRQTA